MLNVGKYAVQVEYLSRVGCGAECGVGWGFSVLDRRGYRWVFLFAALLASFCLHAGWFDTGDMLMAQRRPESAYRVYSELTTAEGVPSDGLLFRLAECEMEIEERTLAVEHYQQLLTCFPHSPYALESRFRLVAEDLRSPNKMVRRAAVGDMLEFCYGAEPKPLAEEAALAAATACYNSTWYFESRRIAERMLRRRPDCCHAAALMRLQRWSTYRMGDFATLKNLCADSAEDDAVYLRAAVALAEHRDDEARDGFYVYLANYPDGLYRALAKSALAKMLLDSAAEAENAGRAEDAMAIYDRVIEGFSGADAEEATFRKAAVEFGRGSWTNVCETLSGLLATNGVTPRLGPALYLHGMAEWKIGNTAVASNLVAEALSVGLTPDYAAEAQYFLDFLTTNELSNTEQMSHE